MSRVAQIKTVFRSPRLQWVRDIDKTIVIDESNGQVHTLQGLDRMVWSWLTLGYAYPRLVSLLAAALAVPSMDAEQHLATLFLKWTRMGLLVQEANNDG